MPSWCKVCAPLFWGAFMAVSIGAAHARNDAMLLKQLRETIAKVQRMSGPSMARSNAAEHLSDLTEKIDPKRVDDKTLRDLVSLLDTSDDSVRAWVASSLGNLGPRAKPAVPKLLEVLREVDCLQVELSSAAAIRPALKRIGVTPPPRRCGEESH